jgi:mono/diheme cytochrome c family protein
MSHPNPSPLSTFTTILNKVLAVGLAGGTALLVFTFATSGLRSLSAGDKKAAEPKTEAAAPAAAAPAPAAAAPAPAAGAAPAPAAAGDSAKDRGKVVYNTICIPCHQPTGMGLPNMFPPLVGSDWPKAKKPDRLIRMILHGVMGPIKVNGQPFNTPAPMMPGQAATLSDQQIADVLTFVRAEFGGGASEVTPDQVKAIREAEKARATMWTEAELEKIPVE